LDISWPNLSGYPGEKTAAWNTQVTSARQSRQEVAKQVLKAALLNSGALFRSLGHIRSLFF